MKDLAFTLLFMGIAVVFYETTIFLASLAFVLAIICFIFPGLIYLLMMPVALYQEVVRTVRNRLERKKAASD